MKSAKGWKHPEILYLLINIMTRRSWQIEDTSETLKMENGFQIEQSMLRKMLVVLKSESK